MKTQNIYKGFLDWQSEFDHCWACWANNHMGWAKMKKANKMKITNNNKIADQQINDSNKSDIHLDKDQ